MSQPLPAAPPANHGNTKAAWVTTMGITLGVAIAVIGFILEPVKVLVWVGLAIVIASLLAGKAMRALGYGQTQVSAP